MFDCFLYILPQTRGNIALMQRPKISYITKKIKASLKDRGLMF